MNEKEYELEPCRVCHEDCAYMETEGDAWVYVACANCGTETAGIGYRTEEEKEAAAEKAVLLWNTGKVIAEKRGE